MLCQGGWVPFRRERKLNGLPLRAHSLFTRSRETNHVGTNKNAAQSEEETRECVRERMKGRNQSRQRGKEQMRTEEPSLMLAEADGVQQGIPDSKGSLAFEGEFIWVLFQVCADTQHLATVSQTGVFTSSTHICEHSSIQLAISRFILLFKPTHCKLEIIQTLPRSRM